MKLFIKEFGGWLRHKVRVIIVKQVERQLKIYSNLQYSNKKYNFSDEEKYSR